MKWPNGKRAAFTIIDDTDDAELPAIREVYDHLIRAGIRSTKTVWVHPVRDTKYFRGDTLTGNPDYAAFIRELMDEGFEIGIHNVGSGDFTRAEIKEGLEIFKETLGDYPTIHVNHSYNKDNIYSGEKRFGFPFQAFVRRMHPDYTGFEGDVPTSQHYWGDLHKRHIRYSRSHEVDRLNLLKAVKFPYSDRRVEDCCNAFYPATFCPNQDLFARFVTEENLSKLIKQGGIAIVYTHFGYYHERGGLDPRFVEICDLLRSHAEDLWFAPVSEVLDHMAKENSGVRQIGTLARWKLEIECLVSRFKYRYLVPLDDFHYKKSIGMSHRADD
jgi:hypothetical protein